MGKSARARALAENEACAKGGLLRVSPFKLNLVARMIRGKPVETAMNDLEFCRKRVAGPVRKLLKSAIDNAENNHNLDVDYLIVAQAHVGKHLVMKRTRPRARGRFAPVLKPFSRMTIIVREVEDPADIEMDQDKETS